MLVGPSSYSSRAPLREETGLERKLKLRALGCVTAHTGVLLLTIPNREGSAVRLLAAGGTGKAGWWRSLLPIH